MLVTPHGRFKLKSQNLFAVHGIGVTKRLVEMEFVKLLGSLQDVLTKPRLFKMEIDACFVDFVPDGVESLHHLRIRESVSVDECNPAE